MNNAKLMRPTQPTIGFPWRTDLKPRVIFDLGCVNCGAEKLPVDSAGWYTINGILGKGRACTLACAVQYANESANYLIASLN